MKKIACLFFAQLLTVMSMLLPTLQPRVARAATVPPAAPDSGAIFSLLRDEHFMRVLDSIEHEQKPDTRQEEGRSADMRSSDARGFTDFLIRGAGGPFSTRFPLIQDEPPDEEACKRIARELITGVKQSEKDFAPITSHINSQMGVSGSKLDINLFRTLFTGVMEKAEEGASKRGLTLPGAEGGGTSRGGMVDNVFGIIGSLQTVITILEDWDKSMEYAWANDLIACGLAHNPDEAFEKAEAMGDIRMHWFIENDLLRSPVAQWYHGRELKQDGRFCLAENHDRHKEQRPTPGADYRQPNKPMRPNDNHGDPRTSGACKTYKSEVVQTTGEHGEIVSTGVTLTCIEYW